ncbi:MAG: histidine--tRNA ligase [Spirochaetes bacterium]|nr:histidine--tRNA ligase [Spirochaetota bacterium]
MIAPKILKGFRDSLPETMILKKEIIKKLEIIFESFGFVPIDTPALEYTDILLGKGGGDTDKQIYRFKDHGKRDVSMRFDLTVPLARFVAQHYNELSLPFKCYHTACVWRGENTQKGRYREFDQCDFDILGTTSLESDIEILLVIKSGLQKIGAGDFRINVNNRKLLNALLTKLGLIDKSNNVLRVIDKIYKIGIENVLKELVDNVGIKENKAEEILIFLNLFDPSQKLGEITNEKIFDTLDKYKIELGNEYSCYVDEIEYVFLSLKKMGILNYFAFNPAITRGLDYYTGMVFESFILDRINFGSICSGGRYDNLTSLYSKNAVPGVGASFGLDRLLSLIEDKKIFKQKSSKTDLLIFNIDPNCFIDYQILAEKLRSYDIKTEVFFDEKKIAAQFKFAERKAIKYVIIAGTGEINNKKYNLKNIQTGEEKKSLGINEIVKIVVSC